MSDTDRIQQFIQKVVHDRFAADLHWYEEFRAERGPISAEQAEEELQKAEERLARMKLDLATNDCVTMRPHIAFFVQTHYSPEDAELIDDHKVLDRLCREVQKARIAETEIEIERGRGNYSNPYDDSSAELIRSVKGRGVEGPAAAAVDPPEVTTPTLGELRDKFMRENESSGKWGEKKNFYSLRHTFDNTLKQAGLLDVRLPELMGHSLGNDQTFGRYGKHSNPWLLQEAIAKLDYGLDLSVLKGE